MSKCPKCQTELQSKGEDLFFCPTCTLNYRVKRNPQSEAPAQSTQQSAPAQAAEQPAPSVSEPENPVKDEAEGKDAKDKEIELLKARLDALEAEKKQNKPAKKPPAAKEKLSAVMTKVAESPAWAWFKKRWFIICPAVLVLLIFIILMSTLVGIRGIYVNVGNPNEFYSFTATTYEYHGTSMFGGGDYVDKGSWKKSGNKLVLTYKDEDFGKITEENVILKNEQNKVLVLQDELGMQRTFKRVNIVNYSSVVTKAKITFDANGGLVNNSDKKTVKVKIGSKVQAPIPSRQDCQFMGWYTEPYGYKSGTAQMFDQRTSIWENVTYYANWYNPNDYEITLTGEGSGTIKAKEGDNLLKLLQAKYEDCEFTFNDKVVDSSFTMPAQNIEISCSFSEAYWQKFEAKFSFGRESGDDYYISCKDTNISGEIVIPSNYRGHKITAIYGFRNCTQITSITIPDSVTSIGERAFDGCSGLTSITIPDSVTKIEREAFWRCSGLTKITIPGSVTSIGIQTFSGCSGLTSITILDGVAYIASWAFEGCSKLRTITIPDSVTSIGNEAFKDTAWYENQPNGVVYAGKVAYVYKGTMPENTSIIIKDGTKSIGNYAFQNCTGLTSIIIPDSVIEIGEDVFDDCSRLTSITVSPNNTKYASQDGILYNIEKTEFVHIPEAIQGIVTIADGITSIGNWAFSDCSGLTGITIPDSVTSIGYCAFEGCSGLTSITISDRVTSIEGSAFYDCNRLTIYCEKLDKPSGWNDAWNYSNCPVIWDCNNNEVASDGYIYVLIDGIKYALRNDSASVAKQNTLISGEVVIPEAIYYKDKNYSLMNIGDAAFRGCSELTSITIPNSVTNIGDYAFYECSGLTNITIPNSMTSIGSDAFKYCYRLIEVYNKSSLDIIAGYNYYGYVGDYAENVYTTEGGSKLSTTADGFVIYDNTLLVNYVGNKVDITIPDSVTSIGDYAFYYCSGLTSITIPDSVTSIGDYAFYYCSELTSLTIPNSVTSIGSEAFYRCSGLTSVTIGTGVTNIGGEAFEDCSGLKTVNWNATACTSAGSGYFPIFNNCINLTTVIIGDNVTSIPSSAFIGCSELTSITIPDRVTSIGDYAFDGCSGLTSITIPDGVTSIGYRAFYNCSGLTSITIGNSVTSIGSRAFEDCSGLTSVTIPDSVTSIGSSAFYNCSGLTSITIPDSVTSIGDDAFYGCSGLTSITIGNGVTNIGGSAFEDTAWYNNQPDGLVYAGKVAYKYKGTIPENTSIILKDGTKGIGDYAFSGCSGLTRITIPNSVISIGRGAFAGCNGLTRITIPDAVTRIGYEAFYNCNRLTTVNWNATACMSVGSDPFSIFNNCTNLTTVIIGDNVTSIPSSAFYGCSGLTTVYWNATACTSAGSDSSPIFNNCTNLTTVIIGDNVTLIPSSAFYGCSGLTSITIPDSVTRIGMSAFSGTAWYKNQPDGLVYAGKVAYKYKGTMPENTSIILKDGTKSIVDTAFRNCRGLTSITIPDGVTSIGDYAFYGCSGLTSVTIGIGVTSIGDNAFSFCSRLTSISIPNSVTSIGDDAFSFCSKLTSISIPNSVTRIGMNAFSGTAWYNNQPDGLVYVGKVAYMYKGTRPANSSIILKDGTKGIGCYAFENFSGLTSITIPDSVINIGRGAFAGCSGLTKITIPDSVTEIGAWAFSGCSRLTSITIPDSVTSIGRSAFEETAWYNNQSDGLVYAGKVAYEYKGTMPENTSIILRDGTKGISEYAFSGCSGLTSITIPDSVTSIGFGAFKDCDKLTSIVFNDTTTWYRTKNESDYKNKTGGTEMNVTDSAANAKNFYTYYNYYWYKK